MIVCLQGGPVACYTSLVMSCGWCVLDLGGLGLFEGKPTWEEELEAPGDDLT